MSFKRYRDCQDCCLRGYELRASCWTQAKKIACLSALVAHLKMVEGNHHAIKHLDCEMEKKVECCAKAAGVEAVICCRCAHMTPCRLDLLSF